MASFYPQDSPWAVVSGSAERYVPPMKEDFAFCCDEESGILYLHGGIDLSAKGGRSDKLVKFDFRAATRSNGSSSTTTSSSVGRRSPSNNSASWRRVKYARASSAWRGAPKARASHAMAVHDGGLFVFGGEGEFPPNQTSGTAANTPRHIFGDFYRYDIATSSWQRFAGTAPSARRGHSMTKVALKGCKAPFLIVFGGCGPDKLYRQDVFLDDIMAVSLSALDGKASDVEQQSEVIEEQKQSVSNSGRKEAGAERRRRENPARTGRESKTTKAATASSARRGGRVPPRARGGTSVRTKPARPEVEQPPSPEWHAVRILGKQDEEKNVAARNHMTKAELIVEDLVKRTFPCPRAGHTMTYVPSSQTLFLIGGVAPQIRATSKGTVAFSEPPGGRAHNFAPASIHALKLSAVSPLRGTTHSFGAHGLASSNVETDDAATRIVGVWTKFAPTGQGPGEIFGHSAVIDPSNDRFIYVYGGIRRKFATLDPGMYVLDTQLLHWTYVPAPRGDYNNPESLFLDHPVQDAIVPPSRRNHGAFFLDKKMIIYGGCGDRSQYTHPDVYFLALQPQPANHANSLSRPYTPASRPSSSHSQFSSPRDGKSRAEKKKTRLQRYFRFAEFVCNALSKQPTMARKLAALPDDASIEVLESVVKRCLVQKRGGGSKPGVAGSRKKQEDNQQRSILERNESGETTKTELVGRRPWRHGGSQGRATLASIPSHKLGTRSRGHGGKSRVTCVADRVFR
eukprot:INCI1107.3.p1 GENE.INCI1107.3~~INCI1107.3.p1  ORF type:complete len:740 (-),score=97.62 INCI1107.3:96-2315(-)